MTNRYYHPVAWLQGSSNHRPKLIIESAGAHTAKRLVLYRNLVGIEILACIESPSPLSVRAIALCAVAHGRVANEEQYWVVAFASRTWFWSRHQCFSYRVGSVVYNFVNIFYRVRQIIKILSPCTCCCCENCNSR